jgi:dTDP-4-amino-4,6-dideoxy-D-glucose transaminase
MNKKELPSGRIIPVTKPYMPPLEEYIPYLERIWASGQLTNAGEFHSRLEQELADYLGVEHLSLFTNGTIALVTALQTLRITGEVITTPYSFVATAHSLLWNNIRPVFVDIDPITFNLDPDRIESAITPQTTAIMPVHCYGNPCDVERIQQIADTYGLRVIYDAAHAFGIRYKDKSLLRHGDLSILSFHATKVFNTFEGGAIICPDVKTKKRVDYLKNFGFADEVTVVAPGINGKMSEVQAAFGLLQLDHVAQALQARRRVADRYCKDLGSIDGLILARPDPNATQNHSYFPVLIDLPYALTRDELYARLKENDILSRRYFFPLISDMPMYRGLASAAHANLPVARSIADRVLCLPIYPDLTEAEQDMIVQIIREGA